jgi:hypothetical protein
MSSQQERLDNSLKVDFIINEAAGSNESAKEYLQFIAACGRITDDIFDDYNLLTQKDFLTIVEILFIRLSANSFYRKHQDILFSQHVTMWNAWEASNFLDKGDNTDKIYAHVLRDYINELLPLVALLTQGQSKMKEINVQIRSLFKKELGE